MDQGSNKNHSPAYNFTPTVTKFCVMWEGLSLPHDTKFGNCRCKIVDSRSFHSWSLIHGLRWSGLIKVGPESSGFPKQRATYVEKVFMMSSYYITSNISGTIVGNKIVDYSDVVESIGCWHCSYYIFILDTWLQWIGQRQLQAETRTI